MTARSAVSSVGAAVDVDEAAIATAVAGAIDIPTAIENATAVADSAGVALAVQGASEDAITAKISAIQSGLATSSAVSTLQTTCNALPSASAIATAVGAQAACAAALTAAAGAAIPSVVQIQSGLATASALAPVAASVVALTATAFEHLGADIEVEAIAAAPGFTIVVWGYEAYSFSGTSAVEWRLSSGDAIEDPGNVDVTKLGRIPASASRIFPPGARGLFSGQPSKAIFSKKGDGIDIAGTIWWTTIPN